MYPRKLNDVGDSSTWITNTTQTWETLQAGVRQLSMKTESRREQLVWPCPEVKKNKKTISLLPDNLTVTRLREITAPGQEIVRPFHSFSIVSTRIVTHKLLLESLGYWTHKTKKSWRLATHFNPYETRFSWRISQVCSKFQGGGRKRKVCVQIWFTIHKACGMYKVTVLGKLSPSVV